MGAIAQFFARNRPDAAPASPTDPIHILIACMPKSGSTFLSDVISELPGFRRASLIPVAERREQELDEFCLQQADGSTYVAQHHVRYSSWTADMSRDYRLTPVVLVRSLLDVVVSMRDHVRRESPVLPNFFADERHAALDDAALEQMIARLALPWYLNFYMGWREAPGALMVSYEALMADPVRVVGDILAHAGVQASADDVRVAVQRVSSIGESRLNVGISGRGSRLRPETIRAVLELIDFYPEAADSPYIQAIRAQANAALFGKAAPVPLAQAPAPAKPAPRLQTKARLLIMRRVVPLALVALAGLYWLWPNDIMRDSSSIGYADDGLIVLVFAFVAGRLSRHKGFRRRPRERLRRERPAAGSPVGIPALAS
ncbi:MAG: sulfotransferase domain-containing protein [Caulobacteraceae bacterium]|nr:sulfotransferase domain-containing protein [Caulobacteraceae bacterium]